MKVAYSEGLLTGYRHFDQAGKEAALSVRLRPVVTRASSSAGSPSIPEVVDGGAVAAGGAAADRDGLLRRPPNVGRRAGAEIVQVYVADRPRAGAAARPRSSRGSSR